MNYSRDYFILTTLFNPAFVRLLVRHSRFLQKQIYLLSVLTRLGFVTLHHKINIHAAS